MLSNAFSRRRRWLLEIGWSVIVAKCLAVPWVVSRWQVPIHPGWIIIPTLIFGVVITLVVLTSREKQV
jgi:hypothetical protein